jgi:hypothetical protein
MWQLTPFVEWAAFAFAMSVNLETDNIEKFVVT